QPPELVGLSVDPFEVAPETVNFDLWLNLSETPEGLCGWLDYSTDLFDAATIDRLGRHFETLIEAIVDAPQAPLANFPLLQPDEQPRLLVEWNATPVDYPTTSVSTSCLKPRWYRSLMPLPCGMRMSTSPTVSSIAAPIRSRITYRPWEWEQRSWWGSMSS